MTQEQLAAGLNKTFQQVAKYEAGKNRISAGTLFVAAQILDTPVTWFFEGIELATAQMIGQRIEIVEGNPMHTLSARRTAELNRFMRLASRISDPEHRNILLRLMTVVQKL